MAAQHSAVEYRVVDHIAVVTINNPPVNALGINVRLGLAEAVKQAKSDPGVIGLVLAAKGRMFSGGADIAEFDKPPQNPLLPELIGPCSELGKPTVAAIQGAALGGGLELALGCDARVASANAQLGLPEIKLGFIPGAGGTQRLPRLIGARAAFEMMLSGNPISAQRALDLGLVDLVTPGDPLAAAMEKARLLADEKTARHRINKLEQEGEREAFEKAAESALKQNGGATNVKALVEAVRRAFESPLSEGLAFEREQFVKLRDDKGSKALRYLFFAVRKAAKVEDLPSETTSRTISRAAVIGAGTMGGGIAITFANAGIPVTIIEEKQEALTNGLKRIEDTLSVSVKRGSLKPGERDLRLKLISGDLNLGSISDADMIVEAVFEEMPLKKAIFSGLDKIAKKGAILATNTSYLNVNEIAGATGRPEDVLGLHFFSPANVMRLLEVVRAEKTAPDVLKTALDLAQKLGKVPVVVGVCHGFVGNRMLSRRSQQAERLLIEGALPQDIDGAMVEFGFRMGPLAVSDLAGLDIGWRLRKAMGTSAAIADTLCEQGRFGQKAGRGYYLYPQGSREGVPDPEVESLIKTVSNRLGVERRRIAPEEIVERLIFPMVNEGAKILDEKIAARASDIDVIWANGYGWPAWRGGPMYYADRVGLKHVASRLEEFAKATGDESLKPGDRLNQLAASGRTFTGS